MTSSKERRSNDIRGIKALEEIGLERDGLIPGWSDVANQFRLNELSSKDRKIVLHYYRGHRMIAQGKRIKGRRTIEGVSKSHNFLDLEHRDPDLLTDIAKYVRGPSERRRQQD